MLKLPTFVPSRHHFGLSISRSSLRGLEIMRGQIVAAAEVPLPEGVYNEGILVKKEQFVLALKKLLTTAKFSTKFVAVCFSEAHAYSREYTLPPLLKEEIQEAISWHVKDLFPLPVEELYFDWKLVETTPTGHHVIVMAVQKKLIDPLVEVLVNAGLKPLCFEPGSSSVARLLHLQDKKQVLLTEVNHRGAYVTLVEGEKVIFTTVINYTSEDTPDTYLKNVCATINEMFNYYQKKAVISENSLPVVLTGEVANAELVKHMTPQISFPITILETPVHNVAFNKCYAIASSYIAAPLDPRTINLLPSDLQRKYDQEYARQFYKSLMLRINVALGILTLVSFGAYMNVTFHQQSLDERAKTLSQNTKNQGSETQKLLLLNAQAKNIVTLTPLRKTPKDQIAILEGLLPATINIIQWNYDDSKLEYTLTGVAASRDDLLDFKAKIEQSEEFTKVTLPLGSLEIPENVRFTISFVTKK